MNANRPPINCKRITDPLKYVDGRPKYRIDAETGCWIWIASISNTGYGHTAMGGYRKLSAHRASWEIFKGTIPHGLHIDHLCGVRSCVNPDHLQPVPQTVNTRRGKRAKIDQEAVDAMRSLRASGSPVGEVAVKFGLSPSHTSRVLRGIGWGERFEKEVA